MARKRYSDEDILKLLREIEVHVHSGMYVVSACRKAGVSDKTYYAWRKKFGGMEASDVRRLKQLEDENTKLKKLLAESMLDNDALKAALNRKY